MNTNLSKAFEKISEILAKELEVANDLKIRSVDPLQMDSHKEEHFEDFVFSSSEEEEDLQNLEGNAQQTVEPDDEEQAELQELFRNITVSSSGEEEDEEQAELTDCVQSSSGDDVDEIKTTLLTLLDEYKGREFKNIEKEQLTNRDQTYAFQNMGNIGEEIGLVLNPGYLGSASKGGCAYDLRKEDDEFSLIDAKEVKCASLDGSKICIPCKRKCPRFQKICLKCKKSDFKLKADSRAVISAKSHIKYTKISEYIFIVVKYCEGREAMNILCWKIKSDNKYFNDYIVNQGETGGDWCNCLPGSMDFHLSGPIKLFEIYLYKEKNVIIYCDINNNEYEDIPLMNFNTMQQLKYNYYDESLDLFKDGDKIDYVGNIHHFKLKSDRSNTHGKKRGIVNRK